MRCSLSKTRILKPLVREKLGHSSYLPRVFLQISKLHEGLYLDSISKSQPESIKIVVDEVQDFVASRCLFRFKVKEMANHLAIV